MDVLMDPIVKYGFAGFAAMLLGILVWIIRHLLAANRREAEVIAANTDALRCLKDAMRDVLKLERESRDWMRYWADRSGAPGDSRIPALRIGPPDVGGPRGGQDVEPSGGAG